MGRLLFTARSLGKDFGPAVFRPVEGQATALDQHPAADHVVDHQQQEPDRYRGLKSRQQRLSGGQIADGRREDRRQRGAEQQIPQHMVDHVIAATLFVEIEWDPGLLQAQRYHRQRTANQHKAEATQRAGKLPIVEVIKHDQRHNQRHDKPNAHQIVAHGPRHAITRPAKVGDKQPVRTREGGADHHHPQQRHGSRYPETYRHRQRVRPGFAQAITQGHPQHRQR